MFLILMLANLADAAPNSIWGRATQEWLQDGVDLLDEPARLYSLQTSQTLAYFSGAQDLDLLNTAIGTVRADGANRGGFALSFRKQQGPGGFRRVQGQGASSEFPSALTVSGLEAFEGRLTGSFGKARSGGGWGLGSSVGLSWLASPSGAALALPPAERDGLGRSFGSTRTDRSSHLSAELFGGTAWDTDAGSRSVHVYGQFERALDVAVGRETEFDVEGVPVGQDYFLPDQTGLVANRWVAFLGARSEVREAGRLLLRFDGRIGAGGPAAPEATIDGEVQDAMLTGTALQGDVSALLGADIRRDDFGMFVGGRLTGTGFRFSSEIDDGGAGDFPRLEHRLGFGAEVPLFFEATVHPRVDLRFSAVIGGSLWFEGTSLGQMTSTTYDNRRVWTLDGAGTGGVRWFAHDLVWVDFSMTGGALYTEGPADGSGLMPPFLISTGTPAWWRSGVAATLKL